MPTYRNTAAFSTGGRIYSNENMLSTNQSHPANYFPPANDTLAAVQEKANLLASCSTCNSIGESMPSCYLLDQSFDLNYLP